MQIVVKASGAFLWVDLVVSSLLTGMRYGDRIQDFQRQLDDLPPELEDLYEKILRSLDPFYLQHAAQYFALIETALKPLTMLQFSFADEETIDSMQKMPSGPLGDAEILFRIRDLRRRLNNRCRGLLETERNVKDNSPRAPAQLTVQYLHRTVRDFIKSSKAQEFLYSSYRSSFDPSLQLSIAYVMELKDDFRLDIHNCLWQAARVRKTNHRSVIDLVDELKSLVYRPEELPARPLPDYKCLDPFKIPPSSEVFPSAAFLHFLRVSFLATPEVPFHSRSVLQSAPSAETRAVIHEGLFELTYKFERNEAFLVAAVIYNVVPYVSQ